MKRNIDDDAISRAAATDDSKTFFMKSDDWYVPHYTSNETQQRTKPKHIVSSAPTELHCIEGSVFQKTVKAPNEWNCELGANYKIDVQI